MTAPPKRPEDRVIVRDAGDRVLVARDAAVRWEGRTLRWIRDHVQPVACDRETGTLLLDADEVSRISDATPRRALRRACGTVNA